MHTQVEKLSDELSREGDQDGAMATWWQLLETNLLRMQILKKFYTSCYKQKRLERLKHPSRPSLLYFWWLCILTYMSNCAREWNWGELDWWPLASEAELMVLIPFIQKIEWPIVVPFFSRQLMHKTSGITTTVWSRPHTLPMNPASAAFPIGEASEMAQITHGEVSTRTAVVMVDTSTDAPAEETQRVPQSPESPNATSWEVYVPMTECRSKKFFQAKITIKPDDIDDDKTIISKLSTEYWKTRHWISKILHKFWIYDLKEVRCVLVRATFNHFVNS